MTLKTIRRILGLIILLISLAVLIWGLLPAAAGVQTVPILPADMQLPAGWLWFGACL